MKITKAWFIKNDSYFESIDSESPRLWYLEHGDPNPIIGIERLIAANKLYWANWMLEQVLNPTDYVDYMLNTAKITEVMSFDEATVIWLDFCNNKIGVNSDVVKDLANAIESITNEAYHNKMKRKVMVMKDAQGNNYVTTADSVECPYDDKTFKRILAYGLNLLKRG